MNSQQSVFTVQNSKLTITALLTCHNRRDKTLMCLETLFASKLHLNLQLQVVLVDDGSTDGTSDAVASRFKNVKIIYGDGSLFWNRGMHLALQEGLKTDCDAYLLLNDDTLLEPDALKLLLSTWEQIVTLSSRDAIIVGSTRDPQSNTTSYGGLVRPVPWKKTTFVRVEPGDAPLECEAMNCNCVLLPRSIAEQVGNFDPVFLHAMGDYDYALRARKAGYKVYVAPGYVGICSRNDTANSFSDTSLPLYVRWKKMMQPNGLPLHLWYVFTRRHTGPLWPIFWCWPYLRVLMTSVFHIQRSKSIN